MNKPLPPIRCGHTEFRWGERTYIMGVCNLSPDSFSGDGLGDDIAATLAQAKRIGYLSQRGMWMIHQVKEDETVA